MPNNPLSVPRLRPGSLITVCSPSRSIGVNRYGAIALARQRLQDLGLRVEIPPTCEIPDALSTCAAEERAEQMRVALTSDDVDGIIISTGGFPAIDTLEALDLDKISPPKPKLLCGVSDSTIFTTALFSAYNWQTYYGPNLHTFAEGPDADYTAAKFREVTMGKIDERFAVASGPRWGEIKEDDPNSEHNYALDDDGPKVINPGSAEGTIFAGNLGTLFLLQGTEYWPRDLGDVILFVEDDALSGRSTLVEALRRLRSLLLQPGLKDHVTGLVLGRFQRGAHASPELLKLGLKEVPRLRDIPVIVDAPFGHTNPVITIPIGGRAWLEATEGKADLEISCGVGN